MLIRTVHEFIHLRTMKDFPTDNFKIAVKSIDS